MSRFSVIGALLALGVGAPLQAQRPITAFVYGGGYSALNSLGTSPSVDFSTDFIVGLGVGVGLSSRFTVRGEFGYASTEATDPRTTPPNLNGDYNRYLYAVDLQARLSGGSFAPYVFAGGGAITIDPVLRDQLPGLVIEHFTRPAGRFGVGWEYRPRGSSAALFMQGTGWVFSFDGLGVRATQVDVTYTMGFAYRLRG